MLVLGTYTHTHSMVLAKVSVCIKLNILDEKHKINISIVCLCCVSHKIGVVYSTINASLSHTLSLYLRFSSSLCSAYISIHVVYFMCWNMLSRAFKLKHFLKWIKYAKLDVFHYTALEYTHINIFLVVEWKWIVCWKSFVW